VAPILPGQKAGGKNPAPAQSPSAGAAAATQKNDLIDFGQNEGSLIPADLKAAQTENDGQKQKDLENTLKSTSTSSKEGPLIDFQQDLKANLPEAEQHRLKRQDTDTNSLDEFVDAQS
jgi:hypothetical protein